MRNLRIEAPTGLSLKAYLYPLSIEQPADPAGYVLTETATRQYEVEVVDPLILGTYRVVVEMSSEDITTAIDSGYVVIEQGDGNYIMTNKVPTSTPSQESAPATLTDFGPKRVKTKEMEIEQFDPLRLQMAQDRSTVQQPSWCDGAICVGRSIRP